MKYNEFYHINVKSGRLAHLQYYFISAGGTIESVSLYRLVKHVHTSYLFIGTPYLV